MTVSAESLNRLRSHWAIEALGEEVLDHAEAVAQSEFVRETLSGRLVDVDEPAGTSAVREFATHFDLIDRAATAFEVAAAEGLERLITPAADEESRLLAEQAQAAAYHAYGLRRVLPVPDAQNERLLWILRLAAFAYVADEWTESTRLVVRNAKIA